MKALIHQNEVIQIEENDFPVASPLKWVECDDSVEVGYDYIDGVFTKPKEPELTEEQKNRQVDEQRRFAYEKEADPLFFKWQRGESTEQEWLDKVKEIRSKFK